MNDLARYGPSTSFVDGDRNSVQVFLEDRALNAGTGAVSRDLAVMDGVTGPVATMTPATGPIGRPSAGS